MLYISTILICEDIMNNRDNYFNRKGQESFVDIFKKSDIKNGQKIFPDIGMNIYKFITLLAEQLN